MKSYKMTKTRAIIFVAMIAASLALAIEVKASSANKPSVNVSADQVQSNTVNAPGGGVSNPAGKYPPGHNKNN